MRDRIPSTTALQCLEASARLGSFTRAAAELSLTQSAVSRQVANLEKMLGVALLHRRHDSLTVTLAGESYVSEVRAMLLRLRTVTQTVRSGKKQVNLSAPASIGNHWLIPALPDFLLKNPDISIHLLQRMGHVDVMEHQIDAAILLQENTTPGVVSTPLLPLTLRPYAGPRTAGRILAHGPLHEAPDSIVRELTFIQHKSLIDAWPSWFTNHSFTRTGERVWEIGPLYDTGLLVEAAAAELGLVLLNSFMSKDAVASGRLVRLSDRSWTASKRFYFCVAQGNAESEHLVRIRQWLLQLATETDSGAP